ncbi:uncharacterized protein LOC131161547 isoform X2 [Malania oleifera]|uniref:uncharacterized protein LOC131161547 isoform X2 n=1 Tax=Malania oleifera TaxID=397392 RepID=UPI0025ADA454|nr:uncharacterized protein LOC131161547 isoform X2 [Malania oleifera]
MAVAVAQPQHGIQIVSCPKCRYQYELVSGDIVIIKSQKISMDVPAWERTLNFLQMMRESSAAAVHFVVHIEGKRKMEAMKDLMFIFLAYSMQIQEQKKKTFVFQFVIAFGFLVCNNALHA